MKMSELIAAVGDDNVRVQFLDSCADDLNWSAKSGVTKIRFGTEVPLTPDGLRDCGVVVWMDRAKVKEIMAAEKAK